MKFYRHRLALVALLSAIIVAETSHADIVYTKDGSQIVGIIGRMHKGKLKISTAFAGDVEVDAAQIESISSESPLAVALESGDRVVGNVDRVSGSEQSVETAQGPVSFDFTKVQAVWPSGDKSPAEMEADKVREALWSGSLEAGFRREEGNNDTLEARGKFELWRKTDKDRLKFWAAAEMSEENDVRSTNEYKGGIFFETDINPKWYWYARLDLEYDEFEDLDLRTEAAAGIGYFWIRKPEHEFKNRVGTGYRHEDYDTGESTDSVFLDLGMDYRIDIKPWLQFTHAATYSPDYEDFDDYRLVFDTAFLIPLGDSDAWKLKLGMINEYDNQPQPGIDRLDNTYYANIVWTWK